MYFRNPPPKQQIKLKVPEKSIPDNVTIEN